jgi:hypothetical protein
MWRLIFIVLAIFVAAGCSGQNREITNRGEIQVLANMILPPTATNARCATETGRDQLAYGRFEIATKDLSHFLAQIPADVKIESFDGVSNVTSHKMTESWWRPELLKNPRIVEWSKPGFSWNLMLGDPPEPETVTIYFFNFTL